MLTLERIAEIKARVNAVPKGPWVADDWLAEFIADARQDIPDLLADRQQLLIKIQELSSKTLQLEADKQKLREALKFFVPWHDAVGIWHPNFNEDDYQNAAKVLAETEAK